MIPIPHLTPVDVAFPARAKWIPPMAEIPAQFHRPTETKGGRLFLDIFRGGVDYRTLGMLARDGVDPEKAWKALQVCATTFGIQHEHKEAAFAFLVDQWFTDIRWSTKDGRGEAFEDRALDDAWRAQQGL